MKKLLVCDLDGTLLNQNNDIDSFTEQMIHNFIKSGNEFCICTGRLDEDIKYIEKKFSFKSKYRISQNGCIIRDINDDLVFEATIDKSLVPLINAQVFNKGFRVEVSDANHRYFPSPRDPKLVAEFVDTSIIKEDLPGFVDSFDMKPVIYLIFGNDSLFNEIRDNLGTSFKEKIHITQTSPTSLEIFSKLASKGNALSWILQHQNFDRKDIIVAGDAENDTTMFKYTDKSFSVGNLADSRTREMANSHVNNIGEIIKQMQEEASY
jgi:Cof subfamily protein (haloacid dehalogenase superfamily)